MSCLLKRGLPFALGLVSIVIAFAATQAKAEPPTPDRLMSFRSEVDALVYPAEADTVWLLLSAFEIGSSDVSVPQRLHAARSLARLSRTATGEPAAEARLRAASLYLEIAHNSESEANDRDQLWAEGELAALYLEGERPADALYLARRAYAESIRSQDVLAQIRFGSVLARVLDESGKGAAAVDVLRRTVRLADGLRRERLAGTLAFDPEEDLGIDARSAMNHLLGLLLDEVEATVEVADRNDEDATPQTETRVNGQMRLREVRDLLETQRSAELQDHFGDLCLAAEQTTAPDDIRGTLVLYPILLDDRVALLTGFEGEFGYYRAPITAEAVLDHTHQLRALLEKRTTRQYLRPAQHLYDALIRPIESDIEADRVDTLVVVPDGLLRTVPFAAFHDRKRQRFLVDMKPLALVPSLRLTNPRPIAAKELSILAAGLEQATGGFERLDFTRQELRGLRDRFPTTRVLFEENFQVDALEAEIRTRPYSVVHVATHGRVSASGDESFLLAHDGTLGLERMSELVQATRFRQDTPLELLTLSACETAAGDEAAALGLAGVAVRAGARSALATLWPVNDEATARLIDAFYAEITQPGQTRAGALRAAQRSVREMPRFAHPGYWAPFLMISSWL